MDWLTSNRSLKSIEFYQRKVLMFLYSAEGKDDLRYLNIPFVHLGFYSPLHFISCIPLEMCEPLKNDKLFLASAGDLRKGDKVFLLENGSEGVIKSAVFKGTRLGKNHETEIVLDGHRKTYTSEEVVPYKAYLRDHVGTSLIPESNYVICDGVVQWEEPAWEVGEEIYYKPEKRWATILNREANAKGRNVLTIKMERTNLKKEKVMNVMLNDLKADSIPLRAPKRAMGSAMSSGSSSDELILKVMEPELQTKTASITLSEEDSDALLASKPAIKSNGHARAYTEEQVTSHYSTIIRTPVRDSPVAKHEPPKPVVVPVNQDGRPATPYSNGISVTFGDTSSAKKEEAPASSDPPKPILRKKNSKRAVRPVTEYIPEPISPAPTEVSPIYQDPEPLKFKSCNNLNAATPDDDLDHFELLNYTNSLRSSARKLMQRQLAQEAQQRSLKLNKTSSTRPHVAEIFSMKSTNNDRPKVLPIHQGTFTTKVTTSNNRPIMTTTTASTVRSSSSNNLSKPPRNLSLARDEPDSSTKKPYMHTSQPSLNKGPSSPLDYNFLPLSSSELVKQQLTVTSSRVSTKNNATTPVKNPPPVTNLNDAACLSSDSSSHDNDSGRGSYPFLTREVGHDYIVVSPTPSPLSSDSAGNHGITEIQGTSPNRRYTRNRSLTKHQLQKHGAEDASLEEELNVPLPFSLGNLSPVIGYGKGIQGSTNSTFADATLYAMFACSNIFDRNLLLSTPGQIERGVKRDVRKILRQKIVTPLRMSAYCKSENVTHLREAMLPLSSKMHSSLMDAQEFLYLLFDSALNTESFIEFSNGTKDFMHQVVARPKDRSKSQTVQFMLETSMGIAGLTFKSIPQPALFLCMPRCKGRLVYYEAIIPTLQLNITRLLQSGPKQCVCEMAATLQCIICHQKNGEMALDFCGTCKGIADQIHFRLDHSPVLVSKSQRDEMLNLHSIICTRGNQYVSFVKVSEERLAPWLFFDPLSGEYPEVTLLEDFGKWLDSLEKQPGSYREFAKLHPLLKRIMTDSHIYIYSKMHVVNGPGITESLVI